jgi:transposase-like protein
LSDHLNHQKSENVAGNRKNGITSKMVKTDQGQFQLESPRDRDSSFEPQIIKKGQSVLTPEPDDKIIALYGFGMSYRDISKHIEDMYMV